MSIVGVLCVLLGLAALAAGRQIALSPNRPYEGKTRQEWLALGRAGIIVVGVFLILAGVILLLVSLSPRGGA